MILRSGEASRWSKGAFSTSLGNEDRRSFGLEIGVVDRMDMVEVKKEVIEGKLQEMRGVIMRFYTHPGMSPIYTFCKLSASDWPQKNQRRMANHPTPMMFRIARTSLLLGDPERIGDGGTEAFHLPDFRSSYRPTSSMSKAVSERMPTFAVDGINVAPAAFSGWRRSGYDRVSVAKLLATGLSPPLSSRHRGHISASSSRSRFVVLFAPNVLKSTSS